MESLSLNIQNEDQYYLMSVLAKSKQRKLCCKYSNNHTCFEYRAPINGTPRHYEPTIQLIAFNKTQVATFMNSTLGQNNDCSRNGVSNTDKNLFSTLQDNDNKVELQEKDKRTTTSFFKKWQMDVLQTINLYSAQICGTYLQHRS
jgi:hypothetical protein